MLLAPPASIEPAPWRAATLAVLMAILWVTEAIPIPATALLPILVLPLLGVMSIKDAAAPYANPVIYLFMGGFMIAGALQQCGLHRRIALSVIALVGDRPTNQIAGFMGATALISMWVSNTATVAMMLPIAISVIDVAERDGQERDPNFALALMLGVAYAASIGGLGTLIGTPPNALLAGFMLESYGITIGFARWMLLGVPLVAVALPICWLFLCRIMFPVSSGRIAGGSATVRHELSGMGKPSRAEITVATITALTAAAWVLQPLLAHRLPGISDAGIAVAGAMLLFLVPVSVKRWEFGLSWRQAEKLPWAVLVLFGGGLSLANAIQKTGLATIIGGALEVLGRYPLPVLALAVTAVVIFLTELTSNTATAAAFLPVVASLAIGIGGHPLMLAVPAALAASCAFMLPVATPPNAIVFGSGRVPLAAMARAGVWMNLLMIGLIMAALFTIAPVLFGAGA